MKYNFLINFSKYSLIFFPFLLISGPFFTDLMGSVIGIFTFLFILKNKEYEYLDNKFFYYFILIFIIINLSSVLSVDQSISFKSSATYLRLILFIFALAFLMNHFKDLAKGIHKVYSLCLFILFIDSLLIINFNINILGIETDGNNPRIRSLFDDEEIMGSFISRTLPLYVGLTYFYNNKNIFKYNLIIIILAFFLILISGERTALGNFFIFLFFYFFFERKFLIWLLFSLLIVFLIIFQIKKESIDRNFTHTINQSINLENNVIFFSLRHTLHYYTAFEIFKDYPILGAGLKSFRKLCLEKKYIEKLKQDYGNDMNTQGLIDGCNTHPHHIYLQFLSEIGLIGFLLFLSIFIYITYNLFILLKSSFKNKDLLKNKDSSNYFFLLAIFISMFPFLPSGNYFNNWYIFLNYLPIGLYLANKIKR